MAKKHGRLKSLRVERTHNGITVHHEHEPAPRKKGAKDGMAYSSDYEDRHKEYSFNDKGAAEAHVQQHLGKLFGGDAEDEADGGDDEAAEGEPAAPRDVQPAKRFIRR